MTFLLEFGLLMIGVCNFIHKKKNKKQKKTKKTKQKNKKKTKKKNKQKEKKRKKKKEKIESAKICLCLISYSIDFFVVGFIIGGLVRFL